MDPDRAAPRDRRVGRRATILSLFLLAGAHGPDARPSSARVLDAAGPASAQRPVQADSFDQSGAPRLVIHEIMYNPAGDDPEFLELFNPGPQPYALAGHFMRRGVRLDFDPAASVPAGGYGLIIAEDERNAFEARYPEAVPSIVGRYTGRLDGSGERLTLAYKDPSNSDPAAPETVVDDLRYNDRGAWPGEADGEGASLELVHPGFDNAMAAAWAASDPGGSPGRPNHRFDPDPAPILADVQHHPALPMPGEAVSVSLQVSLHERNEAVALRLIALRDGADPAEALELPMAREPARPPGSPAAQADSFRYSAVLAGLADGERWGFRIRAERGPGKAAEMPRNPDHQHFIPFGRYPQQSAEYPGYHVAMRAADREQLRNRGGSFGNTFFGATLITHEGEVMHGAEIRIRGQGSRVRPGPKNFRVELPAGQKIRGRDRLNFNGRWVFLQRFGMDLFREEEIAAPEVAFIRLWLNGELLNETDNGGFYVDLDRVDERVLSRHYAGEIGRLYRTGFRTLPDGSLDVRGPTGDLSWRGADPANYRDKGYYKVTRGAEDDWSDIVAICDKLNRLPEDRYPGDLAPEIDIEQWIGFFAIHAALGNGENGIYLRSGDDYLIYTHHETGATHLLPWDMDSILLLEAAEAEHSIWWTEVPAIQRFLRHPEIAGRYIARILELFETSLSPEAVDARLDAMGSALSSEDRRDLARAVERRRGFVRSELSKTLDLRVNGKAVSDGAAVDLETDAVRLNGKAPQLGTLRVLVSLDDRPAIAADWKPFEGDWSADIRVPAGRSRLTILTESVETEAPRRIEVTLLLDGPGFAPEPAPLFLPKLGRNGLRP